MLAIAKSHLWHSGHEEDNLLSGGPLHGSLLC